MKPANAAQHVHGQCIPQARPCRIANGVAERRAGAAAAAIYIRDKIEILSAPNLISAPM
jgi:hypothetical protein